jgi:hypothetical protein
MDQSVVMPMLPCSTASKDLLKNDCSDKGKPVVRQGRKAAESGVKLPDSLAAEGDRRQPLTIAPYPTVAYGSLYIGSNRL